MVFYQILYYFCLKPLVMKTNCILLIAFLIGSLPLFASEPELTRLINERSVQSDILKKISDSIIPGRVAKMYLLNMQMQKVILIDDSIIRHTNSLIKSETALSDSLTVEEQRAAKLTLINGELTERNKNDLKMINILKTTVALLLLLLLVLLYFLVFRKKQPVFDVAKAKRDIDDLQKENNALQSQISILRAKEQKVIEDIDKTIDSRIALLQSQLDAANNKNKSILSKIEKLIKDLSAVN